MDDQLDLEEILSRLDEEVSADVLNHWAALLYQRAVHSTDAAYLAVAAEDVEGYIYWLDQLHQSNEVLGHLRQRLRYLRDRTSLELQWLQADLDTHLAEE